MALPPNKPAPKPEPSKQTNEPLKPAAKPAEAKKDEPDMTSTAAAVPVDQGTLVGGTKSEHGSSPERPPQGGAQNDESDAGEVVMNPARIETANRQDLQRPKFNERGEIAPTPFGSPPVAPMMGSNDGPGVEASEDSIGVQKVEIVKTPESK